MNWLVRGTLGILAALALASVAQAQFRPPVRTPPPTRPMPPPMPMPPLAFPPTRPPPSIPPIRHDPLGPAFRPGPVQVIPPPEGVNSHGDGGDECENRDGNTLNDPDDCGDEAPAGASGNAAAGAPMDPSAGAPADASADPLADESANASAATVAAEPAPPGWRPSWWMIVLGVGAVLLLLGWLGGDGRRR